MTCLWPAVEAAGKRGDVNKAFINGKEIKRLKENYPKILSKWDEYITVLWVNILFKSQSLTLRRTVY